MSNVQSSQYQHQPSPVRIFAGIGALDQLPKLIPDSTKVLFITSPALSATGLTKRVQQLLPASQLVSYEHATPNPELDELERLIHHYRRAGITTIVGLGGGSVMDVAKVLSVTINSAEERSLDSILRRGNAQNWTAPVPVVAIPTTAGTGAEVTPFATVWDKVTRKKYSVNGAAIYPHTAILDPVLTLTLPPLDTLYTALDTVSHALESLWNKNRTPISEAYASQALKMATSALPALLVDFQDLDHRAKMQNASTLAGLAISQTRTAIAHSISYPLTTHYDVPHGLACGFTLVPIWRQCQTLDDDVLNSDVVNKMIDVLADLDLVSEVRKFVSQDNLLELVDEMFTPERADNYIFKLQKSDVISLLAQALTGK